ncbi:MAG: DUF4169 family protein [Terricaulis sp.]
MSDIVNLRRLRKIKARAAAEAEAAINRAAHGRSKTEKKLSKAEQEIAARKLDGHRHDERKHTEHQQGEPTRDDE